MLVYSEKINRLRLRFNPEFFRMILSEGPGESFALEIVRKLCMPMHLIAHRDLPAWTISAFFL